MTDTLITIPVDDEAARAYDRASPEDQKKIRILLGLRLRELAEMPEDSLGDIMDDIATKAEERGLTRESLEMSLRGACSTS
jgi:hypothetical protein